MTKSLFLWKKTSGCRSFLGLGLPVWTRLLCSASGQSYAVDSGSCRTVLSDSLVPRWFSPLKTVYGRLVSFPLPVSGYWCCWVALEPIPQSERTPCHLESPAHEAEGHHSHKPDLISFQRRPFYSACRGSGRVVASQLEVSGMLLCSSVWERDFEEVVLWEKEV